MFGNRIVAYDLYLKKKKKKQKIWQEKQSTNLTLYVYMRFFQFGLSTFFFCNTACNI